MEKDLCRSICINYARDRLHKAQRLLERFRICDCSEFGGKHCQCPSQHDDHSRGASMDHFRRHFFIDRSTQTEERIGFSAVGNNFRSCDREDAASRNPPVPRPLLDVNRNVNVYTLAKQRHLSVPEEQVYDGIKNPYVLVINNVNFHYIVQPRTGAKSDERNVDAFVEEAGFKTVVKHFDLRKKKMLELLDKTQRDVALVDHDSFICFIMSHGNEEGILATDGQTIPVDDITAKFQGGKCPYLATKPKLFFIQACRGDVDDEGYLVPRGPHDVLPDTDDIELMPVKLPSEADFLIAYSSTKGHVSHRRYTDSRRLAAAHGRMLGSWFISCLVQVLQKYSKREDLMTMLTRVNSAMCRLYTLPSGCKQISCQLSMLTKKVYFANYLEKESAAAAAV